MSRAIDVSKAAFFLSLVGGCNPGLDREEGSLRVVAHNMPEAANTVDLTLLRGTETRQFTLPVSSGRAEVSIDGLPTGALTVQARALGSGATSLAERLREVTIQNGQLAELVFDFGAGSDAGVPDSSIRTVRSGRILHSLRVREDAVGAGQLVERTSGNAIALTSFLTLAETELGASPAHLVSVEVDLRLDSSTGITHLAELYADVELVFRGQDSATEVTLGAANLTGTPTSLSLMPSGADLIGLRTELTTGRFEVLLRGNTPRDGNTQFEAFIEIGVILSASL